MWVGGFQNKIGVRIFLDHTVLYFTAPMRANKSLIHKHSNSKHLFIDLLTRVLESSPRLRSAVVLNTVPVASFRREASRSVKM